MITNVKNKTGNAKDNSRFLIAAAALRKSLAKKPRVDMIHAQLYPTYVDVFCLVDAMQRDCKISLANLERFVCEAFDRPQVPEGSDMTLSIYVTDNINNICAAYIAAGKELISE